MTRVIIHGCNGKMGQIVSSIIATDPDMEIVAGVDTSDHIKNAYPVYKKLEACEIKADVVIDFCVAPAVDGLLDYCEERQIPCVLCTTGLSEAQTAHVEEASKKVAILKSANMSMGINLLLVLLKEFAEVLIPEGFDVEIVEKHHNQKVDAPSGTALALADTINEELENKCEYVYDRSQVRKKRTDREIGISSVRGGTIVGDHDVIFAGEDEVITISHRAYSKALFAKGAVSAAKFLKGMQPGRYDMLDVIRSRV